MKETEFYKSIPISIREHLREYRLRYGTTAAPLEECTGLSGMFVWHDAPETYEFWQRESANGTFPVWSNSKGMFVNEEDEGNTIANMVDEHIGKWFRCVDDDLTDFTEDEYYLCVGPIDEDKAFVNDYGNRSGACPENKQSFDLDNPSLTKPSKKPVTTKKPITTDSNINKWFKCVATGVGFDVGRYYMCVSDVNNDRAFINNNGSLGGCYPHNHMHFDLSNPLSEKPTQAPLKKVAYKAGVARLINPINMVPDKWYVNTDNDSIWFFKFKEYYRGEVYIHGYYNITRKECNIDTGIPLCGITELELLREATEEEIKEYSKYIHLPKTVEELAEPPVQVERLVVLEKVFPTNNRYYLLKRR